MESRNFFIFATLRKKNCFQNTPHHRFGLRCPVFYIQSLEPNGLYYYRFHRQPLSQDFSRHGLSTAFPVRISAMNTYTGRFRFINKYYVVLLLVGLGRCRTLLPYLFTFEFSLWTILTTYIHQSARPHKDSNLGRIG